ncbi:uracil-DNA glycosylase [candidate division KSB1 bacterium]|nr:MAG: uracil-DNA glycosylase [candidate division KSB1 bacterium]
MSGDSGNGKKNINRDEAARLTRNYLEFLANFEDSLPLPASSLKRQSDTRVLAGVKQPLPESLEAFDRQINKCKRCPLGATRTKFVFGVGNPHARIVFVGEAPGHDEDISGIPFVGRAGQLLDKMLADIGLSRQHVYICNVLKCRPPNNRDPEPTEVATCKPYLLTQLSLIKPHVIVCLGRHAAATLLDLEAPMKELRGRILPWNDRQVLVTYHPAYYLRNMNFLNLGEQDFRLLRSLYDKAVQSPSG